VSDGLSLDIARMMEASAVAAVLDLDAVPIHPDAVLMAARPDDQRSPLEHALGDGEDFELVLAMPPEQARRLVADAGQPPLETRFAIIGEVVAGGGLFARTADGGRRPLPPQGYQHDLAD